MKTFLFSLLAVVFAVNVNSASAGSKEKVTIQTSAQCGECETRITEALDKVDGVKKIAFDMSTKAVTVTFDPTVTNADALRNTIASVGYDADTKTADKVAYEKLPTCCQKGGHE